MRQRRWPRIVAWLSTLLIVAFTLVPVGRGGASELSFCVLCGAHGLADVLRNVLLFLPFGLAMGARGRSARRAFLTTLLFSTGIEFVQLTGLQGRHANPVDVMSNTLGAMVGWMIVHTGPKWASPQPRTARRLAAGSVVVAIAVLAGGRALLAPAPTGGVFHGQWTADFADAETYEGEVLEAGIGAELIPRYRIDHTDPVREAFRARSPIHVRFAAGPEPARLAPLLSIYDDEQMEIFLLGITGTDLVYRYRTRALSLRLDQPTFRIPGAMAGVGAGEVVRLRLDWDYGEVCATVNGSAACASTVDARRGWSFLYAPPMSEGMQRFLDHLWIALLFLPAGFWMRGRIEPLVGAISAGVVIGLVVHPSGWVGAVAAALFGLVSGWIVRRRVHEKGSLQWVHPDAEIDEVGAKIDRGRHAEHR